MKKYIILTVLLILFQGDIHSLNTYADLNRAIGQQLISARKAMNSNVRLELDIILPTLLAQVAAGKMSASAAIATIKSIKQALEEYKSKQYSTTWSKWFGSTPEIVKNQINPALAKVDHALQSLKSGSIHYGYIAGGTALALASAAAVAAGAWYLASDNRADKRSLQSVDDAFGVSLESDPFQPYQPSTYDAGLQAAVRADTPAEAKERKLATLLADRAAIKPFSDDYQTAALSNSVNVGDIGYLPGADDLENDYVAARKAAARKAANEEKRKRSLQSVDDAFGVSLESDPFQPYQPSTYDAGLQAAVRADTPAEAKERKLATLLADRAAIKPFSDDHQTNSVNVGDIGYLPGADDLEDDYVAGLKDAARDARKTSDRANIALRNILANQPSSVGEIEEEIEFNSQRSAREADRAANKEHKRAEAIDRMNREAALEADANVGDVYNAVARQALAEAAANKERDEIAARPDAQVHIDRLRGYKDPLYTEAADDIAARVARISADRDREARVRATRAELADAHKSDANAAKAAKDLATAKYQLISAAADSVGGVDDKDTAIIKASIAVHNAYIKVRNYDSPMGALRTLDPAQYPVIKAIDRVRKDAFALFEAIHTFNNLGSYSAYAAADRAKEFAGRADMAVARADQIVKYGLPKKGVNNPELRDFAEVVQNYAHAVQKYAHAVVRSKS